jgi:hypothetical protein
VRSRLSCVINERVRLESRVSESAVTRAFCFSLFTLFVSLALRSLLGLSKL